MCCESLRRSNSHWGGTNINPKKKSGRPTAAMPRARLSQGLSIVRNLQAGDLRSPFARDRRQPPAMARLSERSMQMSLE
jgi:hypothetical protein